MGPAGGVSDPAAAGDRIRLVELLATGTGVSLRDALEVFEVSSRMFGFAVGREEVGHGWRIGATEGAVSTDVAPPAVL